MQTAKTLIRLGECPGWSESSLGAQPLCWFCLEAAHINLHFFPQSSYDMELQALQEMIQEKVVMLLNDPDNSVKRTLLDNGITRLCVFFGRQKG